MSIYETFRYLRVRNKLKQHTVAEDLGLSITGYAKIERGETDVKYSKIVQIAAYYNMSVSELISMNKESDNSEKDNQQPSEVTYLKEINQLLREKIVLLEKKQISK